MPLVMLPVTLPVSPIPEFPADAVPETTHLC
jgi:hypothetical protein